MVVYDAEQDPYCYPQSTVLKNIPDIRDASLLAQFEALAFEERAIVPFPRGRLSVAHYCRIHRHLFQDVYSWAGQFRKVRISKGDAMFCYPEYIKQEMQSHFAQIRDSDYFAELEPLDFARSTAHFLAHLNAIHPFRDGNGRCQNAFLGLLAARAGYDLDLTRMDPDAFLSAMIDSFHGDEQSLAQHIRLMLG